MKLKTFYDFIQGFKLGLQFRSDFHTAVQLQHEYPHETLGYIFYEVVRKNVKAS